MRLPDPLVGAILAPVAVLLFVGLMAVGRHYCPPPGHHPAAATAKR